MDLPSFLSTLRQALQLNPTIYAAVQATPQGLWMALAVVALASISEAVGQSIVLFVNRIRPARFGLALLIAAIVNVGGYAVWTLTIWLAGGVLFAAWAPLLAIASAVGLAYAPQIFSFFELIPFVGTGIGLALSLWSMFAVIIAIRVGLALETWQAVLLAGVGWILLQTLRHTVGIPILRIQRWVERQAAAIPLNYDLNNMDQLRRRPSRTWYKQLDSWRRRLASTLNEPHPPAPGGEKHG